MDAKGKCSPALSKVLTHHPKGPPVGIHSFFLLPLPSPPSLSSLALLTNRFRCERKRILPLPRSQYQLGNRHLQVRIRPAILFLAGNVWCWYISFSFYSPSRILHHLPFLPLSSFSVSFGPLSLHLCLLFLFYPNSLIMCLFI